MLFRLLIYIFLGVVLWRAAKSWFAPSARSGDGQSRRSAGQVDDVMIMDPVCGTYFPKSKGVPWNGPEEALLFCSVQCRDRYLKNKS